MISVRLARGWSGQPVTEHRLLEVVTSRIYARLWLRPFTRPYYFSKYGPHCFGFLWFGASVWLSHRSAK